MPTFIRRGLMFAVVALCAGIACHAAGGPVETATAPSATATPRAFVSRGKVMPGGGAQPLSDLSEAAASLVEQHGGQIGVSVLLPESGDSYSLGDTQAFPMASLAKVVILLTALHIRERLQLPITDSTMSLMTSMITESDNDSADDLWDAIGDGPVAQNYVDSIGVQGITMSRTPSWGDSTATPRGVATLLGKLVDGQILDASDRALALRLLASVAPDQAWGATAAFPKDATVGVKNGWMPDDDGGWYIHSAAVDESDPSHPIVVVMTGGSDPLVEINWVQTIASAAGKALAGAMRRV